MGAAKRARNPDSALNLVDLQAWHEFCTAKGFTYNQLYDYQGTVREIAGNIAAAGRASLAMRDGKYTIIQDVPQAGDRSTLHPPQQLEGFKSNKNMLQLPHGFRVALCRRGCGLAERGAYCVCRWVQCIQRHGIVGNC
jgi:hypothetical protein